MSNIKKGKIYKFFRFGTGGGTRMNSLFIYIYVICIHKAICKCIFLCHCVTGLLFYDSHSTEKTHLTLVRYIYIFIFIYIRSSVCSLFYGSFQIPIAFSGHGSHTLNMGVYTSTPYIQQNDYCHLENLTEAINLNNKTFYHH